MSSAPERGGENPEKRSEKRGRKFRAQNQKQFFQRIMVSLILYI